MTLEVITADALGPIRHGFCTRKGGASSGVFAGLNCGKGSTDQKEMVEINRARVAAHFGAAPSDLVGVHQVHSAKAVIADPGASDTLKADAIVTNTPGVLLGILTADCAPVLFADQKNAVVGATHAGWRGALDGVLEATIEAMEGLGADRTSITVVVGPTISQRAYEVGPEFLDRFMEDDQENARFFSNGVEDRLQFDLPGFILNRVRNADVDHAEWNGHCTYSDPDRFFSYRRSVHKKEADYGRLISAISL